MNDITTVFANFLIRGGGRSGEGLCPSPPTPPYKEESRFEVEVRPWNKRRTFG